MNSLVSLISQLRDVAWRETTTLLVPHPAVRAWVCMASAVTTVLVLVVRVRRILTTWRAPGKSIQAGATTAWTVRVTRRPCELVGSGVAWDVFPGQALQSVVETRLVGLHGQDAVLVCDLFGGVTPAVEGVHRHHGPFQVHQGQKAHQSGPFGELLGVRGPHDARRAGPAPDRHRRTGPPVHHGTAPPRDRDAHPPSSTNAPTGPGMASRSSRAATSPYPRPPQPDKRAPAKPKA